MPLSPLPLGEDKGEGTNKIQNTPALSLKGEGVRIDVSALPAGVYFVRVGSKMYRFVKM